MMFTGMIDKEGEKTVRELGGELVDSVYNCTHLVTDKVSCVAVLNVGSPGSRVMEGWGYVLSSLLSISPSPSGSSDSEVLVLLISWLFDSE